SLHHSFVAPLPERFVRGFLDLRQHAVDRLLPFDHGGQLVVRDRHHLREPGGELPGTSNRSVRAAALFFEAFAMEYDTVKLSVAFCLPLTIRLTRYFTLGNCSAMNGIT